MAAVEVEINNGPKTGRILHRNRIIMVGMHRGVVEVRRRPDHHDKLQEMIMAPVEEVVEEDIPMELLQMVVDR